MDEEAPVTAAVTSQPSLAAKQSPPHPPRGQRCVAWLFFQNYNFGQLFIYVLITETEYCTSFFLLCAFTFSVLLNHSFPCSSLYELVRLMYVSEHSLPLLSVPTNTHYAVLLTYHVFLCIVCYSFFVSMNSPFVEFKLRRLCVRGDCCRRSGCTCAQAHE